MREDVLVHLLVLLLVLLVSFLLVLLVLLVLVLLGRAHGACRQARGGAADGAPPALPRTGGQLAAWRGLA